MEITVKMRPEEYDSYREYQRDKESLERELSTDYESLRKRHEELCSTVLDALNTETATLYANEEPVQTAETATIRDETAAVKAHDLASDWYA